MDISVKQLVELLDFGSPVFFTEKEKLNKENYFYFQPMGDAEKEAIQNCTYDPQCVYDPTGRGLHMPDVMSSEYFQLESGRNPVAVESIINHISQRMMVFNVEYPILLSLFCVLHEYGHWVHFKNSGKSPYEYARMEANERAEHEKTAQGICAMDDWDPYKIVLARRYHNEIYSNFTSEKFANEYALEHFADAIKKVRSAVGYTEQELLELSING